MKISARKNTHPPRTLFLDRDGVINFRLPGEYISQVEQFIFLEKVPQAMHLLAQRFDYIFVVTNQAGVGKGLMTTHQLAEIHRFLMENITRAGGRIDAILCCEHDKNADCLCRKPAPGMALQAKQKFPGVNFERAWMVGDSASDMVFGKNLGMKTALISGKNEDAAVLATMSVDWVGNSLWEFALFLRKSAAN